jgi:hypothetical protein
MNQNSKRNGSSSQSNTKERRKKSVGKNGSKLYKTSNFMNQTMAQIVQGKDTELFPLVDKKKVSNRESGYPMR